MRIALHYCAPTLSPMGLRVALGICGALEEGGIEPQVLVAEPAAAPGLRTHAYDPAITAPWTAVWQRNWRLPLGLRVQLARQPVDVLLCVDQPGDLAIARLALGYQTEVALISWLPGLEGAEASLAQYADLHLAPSRAHAARLRALPDPQRPVALAPRPVPQLGRLPGPRTGVRLLWIGLPDEAGGLHLLLEALRRLPSDWSLAVGSVDLVDAADINRAVHWSEADRCSLLPAGDPWSAVDCASLCVVTSDRGSETAAIAEAVARGLPVVAAAGATGARDLLEGDAALPLDPGEMAGALSAAKRQGLPDIARRQGQRARAARRTAAGRLLEALSYLPPQRKGVRP
ncbi:MAG: glycosyltransferase [Thermaerobacter sp.]|nr:glycosyltransferase [Thermaerobacter sp.]